MSELLALICGFTWAMVLVWWITSKHDRAQKKQRKETARLAAGVPARCVEITSMDELFKFKNHPVSIDGKVYTLPSWGGFYESEIVSLYAGNNRVGHLNEWIIRRKKHEGVYKHQSALFFTHTNDLNKKSTRVRVLAVLEVY